MPENPAAGFTLLEAVVALAIFTTVGVALYGAFNTNLIALGRVQDVSRQLPTVHNAVEYLASVNPSQTPAGAVALDGFDVRWQATLVEPARRTRNALGEPGSYAIGLYHVEFVVHDGERRVGSWSMRLVGHERVVPLPPEPDVPF